MRKKAGTKNTDWQQLESDILGKLDLRAEFMELGVELTGSQPNENGWVDCRAFGRKDANPSARVNVVTGRYRDYGGDGTAMSLWDLGVACGKAADWRDVRATYAAKVGVEINGIKDPAANLEFRPFNEVIVNLWCLKKPGVTIGAIRAAGGRLARYRKKWSVIALPVFGAAGPDANPVGWVLWNTTGGTLPIFHGGAPPTWEKMKTTGGSRRGLLGLSSLEYLYRPAPSGQVVWLVEGPGDMLALWSQIPPDERYRHLVVTNGNGANEIPADWMLERLADRRVIIVRDADEAGVAGGERWSQAAARVASEVRWPRLPYATEKKHGKDLRDFFNDGHTAAELIELVKQSPVVKPAENAEDEIFEADDNPRRLGRVFLRGHEDSRGLNLRFWAGDWWVRCDNTYHPFPLCLIRSEVTGTIEDEFIRCFLETKSMNTDTDQTPAVKNVTCSLVNNVMRSLEARCAVPRGTEMHCWLCDNPPAGPNCLTMQNGILDLDRVMADEENVLIPHTPEWFSTTILPYAFDPAAKCPRWQEVLYKNLEEDHDRINLLQEWAGYLLTPDTSRQVFMALEGEGRNGKSVYLAGLEATLGQENISNVPLESFADRFSLATTLGKLANIAGDCGEIDRPAEGRLKWFVGGERMQFDRKGKDPISAYPTARLVFAFNSRPRFSDKSMGLWRRMLLVTVHGSRDYSEVISREAACG